MQGMHPAQFFAMMGHAFPAAMQVSIFSSFPLSSFISFLSFPGCFIAPN